MGSPRLVDTAGAHAPVHTCCAGACAWKGGWARGSFAEALLAVQATDYLSGTLQGLLKLNQLAWHPEAAYTGQARPQLRASCAPGGAGLAGTALPAALWAPAGHSALCAAHAVACMAGPVVHLVTRTL